MALLNIGLFWCGVRVVHPGVPLEIFGALVLLLGDLGVGIGWSREVLRCSWPTVGRSCSLLSRSCSSAISSAHLQVLYKNICGG